MAHNSAYRAHKLFNILSVSRLLLRTSGDAFQYFGVIFIELSVVVVGARLTAGGENESAKAL